jgi:cyclophilin family peptidyl-prolyl cis-trans isomerase
MHRVVANFVVQGGGYDTSYQPRPAHAAIANESGNGLSNQRGSVGMARGESPHSATSQFYVNLRDNAGLNPLPSRWGYAVFGRVVEGMDVVDRIAYVATGERNGFGDTPLEPVVIRRASVVGEEPQAATPAEAVPAPAEAAPAAPPAGAAPDPQSGAAAPDGGSRQPASESAS